MSGDVALCVTGRALDNCSLLTSCESFSGGTKSEFIVQRVSFYVASRIAFLEACAVSLIVLHSPPPKIPQLE